MCLRLPPEAIDPELDLSSLVAIFCGAEPVNADTVARFNARFAPYGLGPDVLQPCYGLAEATLIVSGGPSGKAPRTVHVLREDLQAGKLTVADGQSGGTQQIVCCGPVVPGHEVLVVDPHTLDEVGEGALGELWFAGPSVASGYFLNEETSKSTFQACTRSGRGPYLRTGDLGFVHEGGIYIAGRLKELMIIRGRNFYPHDIEATITECLRPHADVASAVFHPESLEPKGLVVMVELGRKAKFDVAYELITGALRKVIAEAHELAVRDIIFVGSGGIPRTSSGKIQRHRCEALYVNGELSDAASTLFPAPSAAN
jgi:acyl-CoA synthetase (AMP-forming)/AMP-acid ligase II